MINAATRMVAVLGYPVRHSKSPLIHNASFQAQGLNFAYCAAEVHPDRIRDAVLGLQALGFAGANVTIPHKEAVVALMDELSSTAQATRAVNTIVCRTREDGSGYLFGDNTDVAGFMAPLHAFADELRGEHLVIFGAGGATRAVVYGLLRDLEPASLTLLVRNQGKAAQVLKRLEAFDPHRVLRLESFDSGAETVQKARLVVNGTPLGMAPHTDATPWPNTGHFGTHTIGYDLVYNPKHTRFLQEIAARGGQIITGEQMFLGQAAAAYTLWTGQTMDWAVAEAHL